MTTDPTTADPIQDAPAGPVLGEAVREMLARRIGRFVHFADPGHPPYGEAMADMVLNALRPEVAALVSSARAEGREEGRGEERERISEACIKRRDWARNHYRDRRDPQYVRGLTMGLEDGGSIARGEM